MDFEWTWARVRDMTPLSKEVQRHLVDVYRTLSIALFAAAASVYLNLTTFYFNSTFLPFLVSIGLLFWLFSTPSSPDNQFKRELILYGFAFCNGIYISPLIGMVAYIDPYIVLQALIGTALIFVCFSASAIFNRDRTYLLLGGLLSSGLSLLFWASLINLFFRSDTMFVFQLYFGLFLMAGFVLFDTQVIIAKASSGYKDYVINALSLFQDFVSIFVRLLVILARNREDNDRRRRR